MTRTTHLGLPLPAFDTTPWHDDMHEAFKLIDAVLYTLTGMSSLKGAWANSTAMVAGDRYLDDDTGEVYQCAVDHTSAAATTSFETDRTNNPTYWTLIDAGSIAAVALLQASNFSDLNNTSTARTNLGVAIGSDVQAYSAVLAATTASYTTAEETKLAGIETGATADQTGAEIKTAYEAEADTNAFTDALFAKLNAIEAGADVTDTSNVTAAGALMDSELTNLTAVKAINQSLTTTADVDFNSLELADKLYFNTNDSIAWATNSGLVGRENAVTKFRIGSVDPTYIETVYSETTASAENVNVDSNGYLRRSTSTGEFKDQYGIIDISNFDQVKGRSYRSLHTADYMERFVGFIKEEVVEAFPLAELDDDNYDHRAMLAILWEVVRSLKARIEILEGED